jgi:hypothetical protein
MIPNHLFQCCSAAGRGGGPPTQRERRHPQEGHPVGHTPQGGIDQNLQKLGQLFFFSVTYRVPTFIITFIQYIHPSLVAEASLLFFIACCSEGKPPPPPPPGVQSGDLNSGLPYSRPANYQLGHCTIGNLWLGSGRRETWIRTFCIFGLLLDFIRRCSYYTSEGQQFIDNLGWVVVYVASVRYFPLLRDSSGEEG